MVQASLTPHVTASAGSQYGLLEIPQLVRRELIAFNIGHQFSLAVDDRGMQRMVHEPFIREIVHSEHISNVLNLGYGAAKKVPCRGVGFPGAGVPRQSVRPIPLGIKCDREQY